MTTDSILVLSVLALTIVTLLIDRWRASYVFGGAATILLVTGTIPVNEFLAGYSNASVITIFLLIILTSAVNSHFNLVGTFDKLYKGARSPRQFLIRMGITVAGLSSVMNNTPIVAMMIPYVYQWGKKNSVSPSKLLIPLSYATILGGMITVLGTSTNMILIGFIQESGIASPGIMDFLIPGVLVSIGGIVYILLFFKKLLPDNSDLIREVTENFKEYLVETKVENGAALVGKTIQEAGLRNLDGIFLIEIIRNKIAMSPVSPDERVQKEDRLFFAGEPEKVLELVRKIQGLTIPSHSELDIGDGMQVMESVIPANSGLIGATLKEYAFRENLDAAVIAIHRNGEKLRGKLGEIVLDKGDLLLISAGKTFLSKARSGKDLYIVSELSQTVELPKRKKNLYLLGSTLILAGLPFGFYSLFVTLLLMLGLTLAFKMSNYDQMKKNISLDLLIILGSAMALSQALIGSGAADWVSSGLSEWSANMGKGSIIVLVYFATTLLTQFITNAAAISVIFPLGLSMATHANIELTGVFMAMAFGASCSFMTPVGYQTNLMVYGPGNYRFIDFIRFGLPLTIIYSGIVLAWLLFKYS
ncbi:MAG: SLC13 family permease [Bacteroidetes bacterium]|nr:SLC13 family permease [Bacteroidota bacterium]